MSTMCERLFKVPRAEVESIVHELTRSAYLACPESHEREHAILWAQGFEFPSDLHLRDEARLSAAHGDITMMIHQLQKKHSGLYASRENVFFNTSRRRTPTSIIFYRWQTGCTFFAL
jgi:hypothetical protein